MDAKKIKRHNLYLPLQLYAKIKYLAEKEMRSVHRQIVFMLSKQVEQERKNWENMGDDNE